MNTFEIFPAYYRMKTLFNSLEDTQFNKYVELSWLCCTMMFRWNNSLARNTSFEMLFGHSQRDIYDWISPLHKSCDQALAYYRSNTAVHGKKSGHMNLVTWSILPTSFEVLKDALDVRSRVTETFRQLGPWPETQVSLIAWHGSSDVHKVLHMVCNLSEESGWLG